MVLGLTGVLVALVTTAEVVAVGATVAEEIGETLTMGIVAVPEVETT